MDPTYTTTSVAESSNLGLIIAGLIFLATLGVGAYFAYHYIKKLRLSRRLTAGLERKALRVVLPKQNSDTESKERRDPKELLGVMESVFASIQYFHVSDRMQKFWLGQPTFSFELTGHDSEIFFYVVCPASAVDQLERIIHGQYPTAHIEATEDYDVFFKNYEHTSVAALKLAKDAIFPFKTYKHLESDPLGPLTNSLSKLSQGAAAIQVVVQPTDQGWRKQTEKALQNIQQGKSFSAGSGNEHLGKFMDLAKEVGQSAFTGKPGEKSDNDAKNTAAGNVRLTAIQEQQSKLLSEKASKVGLRVQVRVLARANTMPEAKGQVQTMLSAYTQFQAPESNFFKVQERDNRKLLVHYIARSFADEQASMLLSTEELTSLYHFPNRSLDVPTLHWLGARKLSPPNNLPTAGTRLGYSTFRGAEQAVYQDENDRMRHFYMIGKTGVGKTNMFQNMVIQDIRAGHGVCYMDPNGDAVEWILRHLPKERAEDVVLFDPSDIERPMALNLLEYDPAFPEQKTMLINEMMAVFDKLYDLRSTGGPMFESYMRSAMLLVMDDPESGSTLMEIPRVLADPDFRELKLSKCTNQIVYDFWTKEAEKAGGEASLANMVPYITSKLNQFTTNDIMRPIIGQQDSAINFREIMDQKKILLVTLPKGILGEINTQLLGMVITARIQLAAFSRQNQPEKDRVPFYLYVDEFQDFTSKTFETILAQARKYKLSLNITNQFITQLDEKMRDAVIGNVGTTLVWRVGAKDAEMLTKEFDPLSIDDMVNTEKYNFYIKMLIDGTPSAPFNAAAYPPDPQENAQVGEAIRQLSRLKYGRDRELVEAEIRLRASNLL